MCRDGVLNAWCLVNGRMNEARRGFMEELVRNEKRSYKKQMDSQSLLKDFWLLNKSFGVSLDWLRRWRYWLVVRRASFIGEELPFSISCTDPWNCLLHEGTCLTHGCVTCCGVGLRTLQNRNVCDFVLIALHSAWRH